jgi:TusA-related sulfurtransferase
MIKTDFILDAKGMACPMPIVKTRKIMKEMESGNGVFTFWIQKG